MGLTNKGDYDLRVFMLYGGAVLKDGFARRVFDELQGRNLPKFSVAYEVVDMWWRKDTPSLFVKSDLEKNAPIGSQVYFQDYGTALAVCVQTTRPKVGNAFHSMSAMAFRLNLENVVEQALQRAATDLGTQVIQAEGSTSDVQ